MRSGARRLSVLAGVLVALFTAAGARGAGQAEVAETMAHLVGEFATVLAVTAAPNPHTAEERVRLDRALTEIADNGYLLSGHASGDDLAFMAWSLAELAGALRQHHRRAEKERFERTLDQMLAACGGCHERTSTGHGSRFAEALLDAPVLASLAPERRVRVLLATRQFERAEHQLGLALESVLPGTSKVSGASLGAEAVRWVALAPLVTLRLDLGLRVVPDLDRLMLDLAQLSARPELAADARAGLAAWQASLDAIATARAGGGSPLDYARRLIEAGAAQPEARRRPYYLEASSTCLAVLRQGQAVAQERARAFYLAALAEDGMADSELLPLRELYLEKAIRAAPGSSTARKAFAHLDRTMTQHFAGRPPSFVEMHLDRLRTLAR